ncbi:hypothetical protein GT347_08865 [Xylophilus rhododendri]|uniref:WYL domain-containing protein n=1 Tax=Xylophilus rhododendri TaxID=2697032 RepID=A0A857J5I2_9BURK|nr:hypothetical protein [Xylophilus rhododendri]QHI98095.1 hypothetical protein GT347_08865 [Xylophilus rhododendri]
MPELIAAVRAKKAISFIYRGARRTVEPHAVGVGHDGGVWLSAYQTAGHSVMPGQDWVYCKVDAVESLQEVPVRFLRTRPGYSREDSRFMRFYAAL